METRASHILIGAFMLVLAGALFAFIIWLSRADSRGAVQYDVFFNDSVAGLTVGGAVRFNGVPVGTVSRIALVPDDPGSVRVRIRIDEEAPVTDATVAVLEAQGLTGVAFVQLEGSMTAGQRLVEPGPFGVPVIKSRPSPLQELFVGAPELLSQATLAVNRLGLLLDEDNRKALSATLNNVAVVSEALADQAPRIESTLVNLDAALVDFRAATTSISAVADTTNTLLAENGQPMMRDMQKLARQANQTLAELDKALAEARPGISQFSDNLMPEAARLIVDMRELTVTLNNLAERVENGAIGALIGGEELPEYEQ